MKHNYFLTTLLILLCGAAFSQQWNYVGTPKFSEGNCVGQIDLHALNDGTPIVGLAQSSFNNPYIGGAVVLKFDGMNWVEIGTNPLVTQNPDEVKVAIGQNDEIYAAVIFGPYIELFHFTGSDWDNIGTITDAYSSSYNELSLQVSPTNEPYLVYTQSTPGLGYPVCKKYNGTSWVNVGASGGVIVSQVTDATDLSFDASGTPYVVTAETNNAGRLKLYRFVSGTNQWELQSGTSLISGNDVIKANLTVISENDIYIGAIGRFGSPFNFRPGVVHYNGADYQWLDSLNAPDLGTNNSRMDMHVHEGEVYRAYDRGYTTGGIHFDKYDSNNGWEVVGANLSNFPDNYSNQTATIAFSGDVPMIGFTEPINIPDVRSSVISWGEIVIDPSAGFSHLSDNQVFLYPNVFSDQLFVSSDAVVSISVFDLTGKEMYQSQQGVMPSEINTCNWTNGMYIAQIRMKSGEYRCQKLIKR